MALQPGRIGRGPLPIKEALQIAGQIADALAEAQAWDASHVHLNGWSSKNRIYLNVRRPGGKINEDVWVYSMSDRKAAPLIVTASAEYAATASPDGTLLAYVSNESSREEVYITDSADLLRTAPAR